MNENHGGARLLAGNILYRLVKGGQGRAYTYHQLHAFSAERESRRPFSSPGDVPFSSMPQALKTGEWWIESTPAEEAEYDDSPVIKEYDISAVS